MILVDKYTQEALKYCEINNIRVINNRIPLRYKREIHHYIVSRLRKEREITAEKERKSQISRLIDAFLKNPEKQILESPIEIYLWEALKEAGLACRAELQYKIGKCRIDIAFPKEKLAIECDGAQYHRANVQQLERDQKRDKYLARKGWRTLRIEGLAIRRDIKLCINKIKQALGIEVKGRG